VTGVTISGGFATDPIFSYGICPVKAGLFSRLDEFPASANNEKTDLKRIRRTE
jgi:hypothetical protein